MLICIILNWIRSFWCANNTMGSLIHIRTEITLPRLILWKHFFLWIGLKLLAYTHALTKLRNHFFFQMDAIIWALRTFDLRFLGKWFCVILPMRAVFLFALLVLVELLINILLKAVFMVSHLAIPLIQTWAFQDLTTSVKFR